ncbi:hypothetical protein BT69DRAFT_1351003 [Atractiella rhizophila]|nr:hypothetical protein BT69DRAFT_1351003 [Atractiella rhizophila]
MSSTSLEVTTATVTVLVSPTETVPVVSSTPAYPNSAGEDDESKTRLLTLTLVVVGIISGLVLGALSAVLLVRRKERKDFIKRTEMLQHAVYGDDFAK